MFVIEFDHFNQHENYNRTGRGIPNDIAVVELERAVNLSSPYISLAKLPRRGDEFAGNPACWVAGWGRLSMYSLSLSLFKINQSCKGLLYAQESVWLPSAPCRKNSVYDLIYPPA